MLHSIVCHPNAFLQRQNVGTSFFQHFIFLKFYFKFESMIGSYLNKNQYYSKINHRFWVMSCFALLTLASCGSSKPVTYKKYPSKSTTVSKTAGLRDLESRYYGNNSSTVRNLLNDAEKYLGTPYRYGGSTPSGFDCSGFTSKVFGENNYTLPRRSEDQGKVGRRIDVSRVKPGDLLFFATSGGTKISHVGIVHDIGNDGEIKFIHASTSRGVIISSLNEKYWNKAYLYAQSIF